MDPQHRMEHQANLLWIPAESEYNLHQVLSSTGSQYCTARVSQAWLDTNFPSNSRDEIVLFRAENVLTPQSLQQMWRFYQNISAITVNGKTFADMCER